VNPGVQGQLEALVHMADPEPLEDQVKVADPVQMAIRAQQASLALLEVQAMVADPEQPEVQEPLANRVREEVLVQLGDQDLAVIQAQQVDRERPVIPGMGASLERLEVQEPLGDRGKAVILGRREDRELRGDLGWAGGPDWRVNRGCREFLGRERRESRGTIVRSLRRHSLLHHSRLDCRNRPFHPFRIQLSQNRGGMIGDIV